MRDAAPAIPPRSAAADRALARAEPPGQARRTGDPTFEDALARAPGAEPERPATAPDRARKAERAEVTKADAPKPADSKVADSKPADSKEEAPKAEANGEGVPAPRGESASGAPSLAIDLLAVLAVAAQATAPKNEGASATETDGAGEEAATDGMAPQPGGPLPLALAPATTPATPLPGLGVPGAVAPVDVQTSSAPPEAGTATAVDGAMPAQPGLGLAGAAGPAKAEPGTAAQVQASPLPQASPQAEAKAVPESTSPAPAEAGAAHKAEAPADTGRAPERAPPQGEAQAAREAPSLPSGLDALARAAGSQGQAPTPAAPPAPAGPPIPVLQNVPIGAVPVEIGLKSLAGMNRFEIRLDPGDLGRIDVTLDIGETGEVKARLVVDRVETLALLQRDARTLERAFEQAGLKASDGSVDLQLRDGGSGGRSDGRGEHGRENRSGHQPGPPEGRQPPAPPPQARPIWRGTAGIDVRI